VLIHVVPLRYYTTLINFRRTWKNPNKNHFCQHLATGFCYRQ